MKVNVKPKKKVQINPKDVVLAEQERVAEIKSLVDAEDYDAALKNLLSDSPCNLHNFNSLKMELKGDQHKEDFAHRHGKLQDFTERPAPIEEAKVCLWSGSNEFGALRCHNQAICHPIETCVEHLGVEHPKRLHWCVYHVKHCLNSNGHLIPVSIKTPNDQGLCNECYVQKNGKKPEALWRVPGTKRIRK